MAHLLKILHIFSNENMWSTLKNENAVKVHVILYIHRYQNQLNVKLNPFHFCTVPNFLLDESAYISQFFELQCSFACQEMHTEHIGFIFGKTLLSYKVVA